MPLVNIMVNSRAYTVACDDGEEEHLRELAAHVDGKVRELLSNVGQVGDARLLLMAALLMADDCHDAVAKLAIVEQQLATVTAERDQMSGDLSAQREGAMSALERAANRAEDIAARFAHA